MSASLAATDLACRRGDRVLFRGLSLALGSGAALHITGANGIGKSSLIRILAGLLSPLAGTVEREGTIGLLDERPALDPEQPLGKAMGFWAQIDGAQDKDAIVSRLALHDLIDVPVRYLSTGQRKRAAMARMVGQGAAIWLLDEPLSGLDHASRELVLRLVSGHVEGGGISIIASHQQLALDGLQTLALEGFAP